MTGHSTLATTGQDERDTASGAGRVARDAAFVELYERYHTRLLGLCISRTRDEMLAEDIVHDTWVRALEHLDLVNSDRSPWAWLKTVAMNLVVDRVRRRRREQLEAQPVDDDALDDELIEDDPSAVLVERPLLVEVLGQLPPRQSMALRLRYLRLWTSTESADLLGLTRPAFEQLLWRARKGMREHYEAAQRRPLRPWVRPHRSTRAKERAAA